MIDNENLWCFISGGFQDEVSQIISVYAWTDLVSSYVSTCWTRLIQNSKKSDVCAQVQSVIDLQ